MAAVENAAWAEAVREHTPEYHAGLLDCALGTECVERAVKNRRASPGRGLLGEAGQGSGALCGCGLVCPELLKLFKRLSYGERCEGPLTGIWMGRRSKLAQLGSNREEPRADLTGGES